MSGHKRTHKGHRSAFESHTVSLARLKRQFGLLATQSGRNLGDFNYPLSAYCYNLRDWPILLYFIMSLIANILCK
jgi:hypothetical protein